MAILHQGQLKVHIITGLFLLFLTVAANDNTCDSDNCSTEDTVDRKWKKYIDLTVQAATEYKECGYDPEDGCSVCLYEQIQKDLEPWTSGITKELLDRADSRATSYQIIDHKLYREKKCVFEARCSGVEYFLSQLVDELPDMDLKINVFDYPCTLKYREVTPPVLSFSKDDNYMDIMYPAWTFWEGGPAVWPIFPTGQGDWEGSRKFVKEAARKHPWDEKQSKGFFIGSRTSAERDPLILLSRDQPDLVTALYTKNQAYKGPQDTLNMEPAAPRNYDEHCPYKYLFNFRGVAASFRFKHLFLCDSLVYHVGDKWLEFFYPAMKPWVHYIPVRQDLTDAETLLRFAKENDGTAQAIARRGSKFIMDHLRMKDIFCYWKRLLQEYSKLLKYRPRLNPDYELKVHRGRH